MNWLLSSLTFATCCLTAVHCQQGVDQTANEIGQTNPNGPDILRPRERGQGRQGRRRNQLVKLTRNIPQCQGVFVGSDPYAEVPCPAKVLRCLKKAHKVTKRCISQELKSYREQGEVARKCQRSKKVDLKKWFELTCLHHTSINKCTKGEEVTSELLFPSDPAGSPQNAHEYLKATECWLKVVKARQKCEKLAEVKCPKFMICSGKIDSAENPWRRTIANLNAQKDLKLVELQKGIQQCIADGGAQ